MFRNIDVYFWDRFLKFSLSRFPRRAGYASVNYHSICYWWTIDEKKKNKQDANLIPCNGNSNWPFLGWNTNQNILISYIFNCVCEKSDELWRVSLERARKAIFSTSSSGVSLWLYVLKQLFGFFLTFSPLLFPIRPFSSPALRESSIKTTK